MRYLYSVLRFVPEPVRGEFVNIGVLAGNPATNEWHLEYLNNFARARALGGSAFKTARQHLDRLDEQVANASDQALDEGWLTQLHEDARSVLQLSPPTPIATESLDQAVELLYSTFILDLVPRTRATTGAVRAALRAAYGGTTINLRENVFERVTARIGEQQAQFDFAIANGHLVQLAKAWSFQTRSTMRVATDVQAWGFLVGLIRSGKDAQLATGGSGLYPVPEGVDIEAVYLPPETSDGERALTQAVEVFEELDIRHHPVTEASQVARIAERALIPVSS